MYDLDYPARDSASEPQDVPICRDKDHVVANREGFPESPASLGDPLQDEDSRHRMEFARYASLFGHEPCRDSLRRLYAAWEDWNRSFFDCQLLPPHFLLAEPKNP